MAPTGSSSPATTRRPTTPISAPTASPSRRRSRLCGRVNVTDNQPVKAATCWRASIRATTRPPSTGDGRRENAEATAANIDAQLNKQQSTIEQAQAAVDADQAPYLLRAGVRALRRPARTGAGSVQREQQAQSDSAAQAALDATAGARRGKAHLDVLKTQRRQAAATIAAKHGRPRPGEAQPRLHHARGAGRRRRRRPRRASGPVRAARHAPDDDRADRPTIYLVANFKETQIGRMCRGESVDLDVDRSPARPSRARSTASRPAPARSSRCCRRRTRPAISPRSSSACRSRSCSIRQTRSPAAASRPVGHGDGRYAHQSRRKARQRWR